MGDQPVASGHNIVFLLGIWAGIGLCAATFAFLGTSGRLAPLIKWMEGTSKRETNQPTDQLVARASAGEPPKSAPAPPLGQSSQNAPSNAPAEPPQAPPPPPKVDDETNKGNAPPENPPAPAPVSPPRGGGATPPTDNNGGDAPPPATPPANANADSKADESATTKRDPDRVWEFNGAYWTASPLKHRYHGVPERVKQCMRDVQKKLAEWFQEYLDEAILVEAKPAINPFARREMLRDFHNKRVASLRPIGFELDRAGVLHVAVTEWVGQLHFTPDGGRAQLLVGVTWSDMDADTLHRPATVPPQLPRDAHWRSRGPFVVAALANLSQDAHNQLLQRSEGDWIKLKGKLTIRSSRSSSGPFRGDQVGITNERAFAEMYFSGVATGVDAIEFIEPGQRLTK